MIEQEWLDCADPKAMLDHFCGKSVSKRKLRLFTVARCRNSWHLLSDERSRQAVEVGERFADGLATEEELVVTQAAAAAAIAGAKAATAAHTAAFYASGLIVSIPSPSITFADTAIGSEFKAADQDGVTQRTAEELWQVSVLRDIFGNPFRTVAITSNWLTWNDCTVRRIAQAIYDERAFDRMPILADALEDAGCTDRAILDHCRGEGQHVRGCWIVDLILGKQ
jgi:hypothetical protein